MRKVETEMADELRPEYDLRDLRVRKVGSKRKGFKGRSIQLEPDSTNESKKAGMLLQALNPFTNNKEITTMHLTEAQISSFHEDGYLRLENVLGAEDLQPVIDEYSDIIDERAQKLHAEGKVSSLHEDEPFTRRLLLLAKEVPEVAGNLDIMQARGEAAFNFLKNPKILDVAESLCGSEVVCNPIQHIRAVLPHRATGGHPTHFHQDAGVCCPIPTLLYADRLGAYCGRNARERLSGGAAPAVIIWAPATCVYARIGCAPGRTSAYQV